MNEWDNLLGSTKPVTFGGKGLAASGAGTSGLSTIGSTMVNGAYQPGVFEQVLAANPGIDANKLYSSMASEGLVTPTTDQGLWSSISGGLAGMFGGESGSGTSSISNFLGDKDKMAGLKGGIEGALGIAGTIMDYNLYKDQRKSNDNVLKQQELDLAYARDQQGARNAFSAGLAGALS